MRSWRSSAAYRISFTNFAASAAGLVLLGIIVFAIMHLAFARQLDSMVSDEAQTIRDEYSRGGDQELARAIAAREASNSSTRMLYAVFDPSGRRIYGSLNTSRPSPGLHPVSFYDPLEGPDSARAMTIDLSPTDRLVVGVDSEWLERSERIVIVIFVLALVGALIVGFAGAIILGSYLQRRLHSISNSAEAIIGGDIRRRMPIGRRSDEFDQLALTLNRMLDRIEGLLENLRQVSSDIAHDLRTPLARLRNHLDRGSGGSSEELIPEAIRQLDDLLVLFAAILRVAEVESGETRRFFAPVDLSAMLTEVAESYAAAFEDQGRSLTWNVEPHLAIEGDRDLLAQAIVNLLENAQRHTPVEALVSLTASSTGNSVSIEVADNGPGVPESDLPTITQRFARLESSRNTPGHGLGLSLVAAVAKLHGGQLLLTNLNPGLCARIDIPRALKTQRISGP